MQFDRETSGIVRLVEAWVRGNRKEIPMTSDFKPLVTWPAGTEYLQKVDVPEQEPLEPRIVKQILDVFSIYELEPCKDAIRDLVAFVVNAKRNSS